MADVIGPNSYLPGDTRKVKEGAMCDDHPDRPAVAELIGETDSFGSETYNVCQECLTESRNAPPITRRCDWCKAENVIVKPKRDYEEGMCGRVYDVCDPCRKRYDQRMAEDLAEDGEGDYYDYEIL